MILLKIFWRCFDDYSSCTCRIFEILAGGGAEIWISWPGWQQWWLPEDTVKLIYDSCAAPRCSTRCNLTCQCALEDINTRLNVLWWVKSQQFIDSHKQQQKKMTIVKRRIENKKSEEMIWLNGIVKKKSHSEEECKCCQ